MDCREVKEKLFAYLDGELDQGVGDLEGHFEECLPCYKRVTLERAFTKVIKARASGHPVPEGLETKIKKEIQERAPSAWPSPGDQPLLMLAAAVLLFTALGFTLEVAPPGPVEAPAPFQAFTPEPAEKRSLEGTLVCVGCAVTHPTLRVGAGHHPAHHRNGIQTSDGKIWQILDTRQGTEILHDDRHGRTVTVEGTLHRTAQAVAIHRYHN